MQSNTRHGINRKYISTIQHDCFVLVNKSIHKCYDVKTNKGIQSLKHFSIVMKTHFLCIEVMVVGSIICLLHELCKRSDREGSKTDIQHTIHYQQMNDLFMQFFPNANHLRENAVNLYFKGL